MRISPQAPFSPSAASDGPSRCPPLPPRYSQMTDTGTDTDTDTDADADADADADPNCRPQSRFPFPEATEQVGREGGITVYTIAIAIAIAIARAGGGTGK